MKLEELKKQINAGEPVIAGRLVSHESAISGKGHPYERVSVLVGQRVVEFMMMIPKEKKAGYAFKHIGLPPMTPVVLLGANVDCRNGFLSCDCESVQVVE
jgi:hypothetical protein